MRDIPAIRAITLFCRTISAAFLVPAGETAFASRQVFVFATNTPGFDSAIVNAAELQRV
ncbi:MAG: hypothetical protein M1830_010176, partial [Pleopsidium flavum]